MLGVLVLRCPRYTIDNADGGAREENVYYSLNQALRARKTDAATFRQWQGYLYFLMYVGLTLPMLAGCSRNRMVHAAV